MLAAVAALSSASWSPLPCAKAFSDGTAAAWRFRGPSTYTDPGDKLSWASATAAIAVSVPPNGSTPVWFAGAVNGGVWRTKDGMQAAQPHWTPVTDYPQPVRCQSIGALTTGAEAGIPHLVVAGCGSSTSSMMGVDWNMADTGDYGGVIISTDYGETWAMAANFPMNANVGALSVLPGAARGEFVLLVAVRSFYFDRDEGGIWRATIDFRRHDAALTTIFERVFDKPVYAIAAHSGIALAALPFTTDSSVVRSDDAGANWASFASGIDWGGGRVPFYPALSMTASTAFVGALTVRPLPGNERLQTNTSGAIFYRDLRSKAESAWQAVANTPRLDDDSMPKDRMALLADPTDPSLLYVAGNGIYTASRVRFATGEWFDLKGPDGSEPHSDMRNFAWDPLGDRLVIVTDGGVSVRDSPHTSARWRSANGDMKTMEMLAASYDPVDDRWIACAQDNSCMLSPRGAHPADQAVTVVDGDGTVTAVDARASPPRLYGGVQSLGLDDDQAQRSGGAISSKVWRSGLRFVQGAKVVDVPVPTYFEPRQMPYFVQPFALNEVDPTRVLLWANSTANGSSVAGVYEFAVPYGVTSGDQIKKPTLLASTPEDCYVVYAGGTINGEANAEILMALSADTLYVRTNAASAFAPKRLPVPYAKPITKLYDAKGHKIHSPTSHGKTVSLAVSASDARTVAVTGWPSVLTNRGTNETIWLSRDLGDTWSNVMGNLATASGVVGLARPGGLVFVGAPGGDGSDEALLVGTINGVFMSSLTAPGDWKRLGRCDTLPLVLVYTMQWERTSDTLVAATMGRGVYTLANASDVIRRVSSR